MMSLLSRFSKVEKSFLGQCLTRHKFSPKSPLFSNFSLFLKYEVPTIVIGNTTDHYDLLNTLKKMAASVKSKQDARRSIFASVMAYLLVSRISGKYLLTHWKGTVLKDVFGVENICFAKFIFLSFGYDDGVANRCNRFLVTKVRDHEGKPFF